MARKGGRRGGRRGGQGNRGRRSKANRSRSRSTKSSSRSKSTSSSRRGGQGNKSRPTGRAKGSVSRKSLRKGLKSVRSVAGNLARGAAARAGTLAGKKKQESKLRKQFKNLRKSWVTKSTKEARQNRRADRLKRQFGLDTRDMRNLKINVNVDQAAKHFGLDTNRFTKGLYAALPRQIRNYKFNTELGGKFRSPHKLGVRDGYRAPNRGGSSRETLAEKIARSSHPEFIHSRRAAAGLPSFRSAIQPRDMERRRQQIGPQQDWLSRLYRSHNINKGKIDEKSRNYWTNEAKTKGRDAVMQSIIGTSKAQGTYGGRREPQRITAGRTPRRRGGVGGLLGLGAALAGRKAIGRW